MVDRAEHRIGDTERQQAIDLLRAHTGAGRLTLDEFSDLAGEVYAAQTYGELDAVGRKLPPGLRTHDGESPPSDAPSPVARSGAAEHPPVDGAGAPGRRRFLAIMCGAHPRGRWHPPARMHVVAFWGGAHIDLRDAVMPGPVVDIRAWAVMGGVTVTVPEGTRVELDGLVLMGGRSDVTRGADVAPNGPIVRVHARGLWGGVTVRNPSRRRRTREAAAAGAAAAGEQTPHEVHDRPTSLLELPQRILDDLDAVLHDAARPMVPAHHRQRPGHPWSSGSPRPPTAPPSPGPAPSPPSPPSPGSPSSRAAGSTDRPSGTLTMMVTDIVHSTRLAETLGDRRWIGVLGEHNALVREQVARHGGTEVKAQGDGFLIVFPSARRAILAAVEVQRALVRYRDDHADTPVTLRIGLHTGEIVDVDGDVLGQNVIVAVRIADEAAPGEIVVSGLTRDLTVSGGDLSFGPGDEVELKGLSQRWRVHRVSWSPTAPAAEATPSPSPSP